MTIPNVATLTKYVFTENKPHEILFLHGDPDTINYAQESTLDHNLFSVVQYGTNSAAFIKILIKANHYVVHSNGLIIRSRAKMSRQDIGLAKVLCTYPEFLIVTNDRNTIAMFARNVTSIPKT